MRSVLEWLERLPIQSDDRDEVRRARLFIVVCLCFGAAACLGLLLLPLMPRLSIVLWVTGLVVVVVLGYAVAIFLCLRGRVDAAALLVGVNLSVAVTGFNFGVGDGVHDVAWLLSFNMIVVGTALRSSKIWIYWVVNVGLYLMTFAAVPSHYMGAPGNPARGPFMLIVLTAMAMSIYVLVVSHENQFQRATEATKIAKQAQQTAQESSRAKSMFLANMSHELRTPLNAITGYAELILEELDDELLDPESVSDDLTSIKHSSAHLLSLINDVLDLSKIESGKMELVYARFDLGAMIADVVMLMQPAAQQKNNRLVCDGLLTLMIDSDEMRVRQVLLNILSNALKFTEQGEVSLSLSATESMAEVVIRDTGIGMSPEQLERVFDAFTQADSSTTRRYGGTGLGLTLCRNFVVLLQGELVAESVEGQGSTFTMRLPLRSMHDGSSAKGNTIKTPVS